MSVESGFPAGLTENEDDMKLLYVTFGKRPYSFINTGEASGVLGGIFENAGGYDETDLFCV